MDITKEELEAYRDYIGTMTRGYDVIDSKQEPTLPVKYPRTPGYRPREEDNPLNAWYWRCDIKGAETGKLQGKTFAIKDNIAVAGVPMMNGSYILEGYVPEYDATIVTRILDAGGRILGKSVCEDLCLSGNSFTSVKGAIRNPHKRDHSAGGSSSGSGALVTSGEVDMAIGGDQAGSIRMPSCWSGNVGLKPTYGLVPYTGIMPIEYTIDHTGPMTTNVYDCALLLEVIAGYDDGLDQRQPVNLTVPEYTTQLSTKLPGIKVGVLKEGFGHDVSEDDVDTMVKEEAFQLSKVGAKVEEVSIPVHRDAGNLFFGIVIDGAFNLLLSGDGGAGTQNTGFYSSSLAGALHKGFRTRSNDMAHGIKMFLLFGAYMKQEYGGRFYAKSQNIRREFTKAYDKVFEEYDVLVMPTLPYKAPKLPTQSVTIPDTFQQTNSMFGNTCAFNLTGHPALTINAGFSDGLPVGMMIVGRKFDDSTVLKVAYAYEKLKDDTKSS
ncbi:amidase-like [Glandiceps talaboti]